ncbi:hypothetical protein niasHT_032833 [Heterodera trifolii]|uniref:CMP/dCMP-type deaminase domain-containing protein n=1 Tax=Heterodera trifolii TaxID=157864 RepID=A0ABD2IYU6_9BILA
MSAQNEFMRAAVEEGIRGVQSGDGGPFGAVIVKNGKIIAQGHNMVLFSNDPTAHAEVVALRGASKVLDSFDLSGCILYTSCYPCPMCLGAVLWSRISNVFYAAAPTDAASVGFDDQNFHEFLSNPKKYEKLMALEHLPVEGHMKVFKMWEQRDGKRMY